MHIEIQKNNKVVTIDGVTTYFKKYHQTELKTCQKCHWLKLRGVDCRELGIVCFDWNFNGYFTTDQPKKTFKYSKKIDGLIKK